MNTSTLYSAAPGELALDETGLNAACNSLGGGAITPAYGPHRVRDR